MTNLKDKIILLTSACGGIGTAVARDLSSQGARLILVDINQDKLGELNRNLGGQHHVLCVDLSERQGIQAIYDYCSPFVGGVDVLINNAGINVFSTLQDMDEQQIERLFAINLISPIQLCKAMMPLLQKSTQGTIVNVGSAFGSIGYPGFTTYCASKFAIRGFTEALRRELGDSKLKVIYFAPRATRTAINDDRVMAMNEELGTKMDTPEVVSAQLVNAIQSGLSRDYYLGWPDKLFVKINSVLPRIVDNSIFKQLAVIKRFL